MYAERLVVLRCVTESITAALQGDRPFKYNQKSEDEAANSNGLQVFHGIHPYKQREAISAFAADHTHSLCSKRCSLSQ